MKTLITLGLGLAALAAAACGKQPEPASPSAAAPPAAAPPLRVGMEIAYKPFEFTDEAGTPQGFDVDLVRALGEHLGRPVECVNLAFDVLPAELTSGRIDVICSGMSYTAQRAEKVDFSRPYAGSPMWALVSVARVKDSSSLAALERDGVEIAVQRGTTGETKARARFPKAAFLVFGTQAEAGNTVATDRADAFVYDKMTIEQLHEQHLGATKILPGDLGQEDYCMAVAKGSPLRAKIDEFLAQQTQPGGKVDDLLKKWVAGWEQYRVRAK